MSGPTRTSGRDLDLVRLTDVPVGSWCQVSRLDEKADLLAGFCIYPGAQLQIRQRYPACVVAAEGLEFALEERLARVVWVRELAGKPVNSSS